MEITWLRSLVLLLSICVCIETVGSNVALLIIDVQNCFLFPGGSLAVADGQSIIPVINNIRREYGQDFQLTVLSQDWHCPDHVSFASQHNGKKPYDVVNLEYDKQGQLCTSSCQVAHNVSQTLWPDHCVIGTDGAAFSSQINMSADDIVIRKGFLCDVDSYSAFYDNGGFTHTDLDCILKKNNIDTVVITGLALDYCVYYTSKDAHKLGYKVYTVLDASRPVSNVTKETALSDLRQKGVNLIQSSELDSIMNNTVRNTTVQLITTCNSPSAGMMTSPLSISTILAAVTSYILFTFKHK